MKNLIPMGFITSKPIAFEKDGEYLDFHVRKQGCSLSCAKRNLLEGILDWTYSYPKEGLKLRICQFWG